MHHLSKPLPFTHWFLAILLASLFLVAASAKYMIELQRWGIGGDRIEQTICTQEAKLCPDGSYVGRTGPNCKFEKCPSAPVQDIIYYGNPAFNDWGEQQLNAHCENLGGKFNSCGSACLDPNEPCIKICANRCEFKNTGGSAIDTSTWKTYRNEQYGFEVKYPGQYEVRDLTAENKLHSPTLQLLIGLCNRQFNAGCDGSSIHVYKGQYREPSISEDTYVTKLRRDEFTFWLGGTQEVLSTFKFIE